MGPEELRAVRLIFRREYLQRVTSVSFLASTFLTPLFFLLIAASPALFATPHLVQRKHIVVACAEPALADDIRKSFQRWPLGHYQVTTVRVMTDEERRKLTAMVRDSQIHAFLWIDSTAISTGRVVYASREEPDFLEKEDLRVPVEWAITRERLKQRGLKPDEIQAALKPVDLALASVGQQTVGENRDDGGEMTGLIVMALLITLLEVSLLSYGIIVMRSVLEDKTSRMMELLLCATAPRTLMAGKILGVGAVSFTQLAIWAGMAVIVATAGAKLIGINVGAIYLSSAHIAFCILFYVLGFIFYSSIYAALGAAFNSIDEAQYWNFLLTLPLLFSGIAAWSLIDQLNSAVAIGLSIFPLSAPIMMSMRIVAGHTPIWQTAFSLALLGGAIYTAIVISSRIYRVGILMYGKKPALREIARWLRYT